MHRVTLLLLLSLLPLHVGCSGSSDAPDLLASEDAAAAADVVGQSDVAAELAGAELSRPEDDLTGRWAHLQLIGTLVNAPVIGQIPTTNRAVLLWDLVQGEDGSVTILQTTCDLTLQSESQFSEMIIPDAFVAAISPYSKAGTVDFTSNPPLLNVPPFPEVHGAKLTDPLSEPLPTTGDDPRVVDADGDGNPGLTMFVSGMVDGAIYVVRRNVVGIVDATVFPDRMEGLLIWSQEQVVLGSDNPILAENPTQIEVDPDPNKTHFTCVRIPEEWGCEEVLAAGDDLFAR